MEITGYIPPLFAIGLGLYYLLADHPKRTNIALWWSAMAFLVTMQILARETFRIGHP